METAEAYERFKKEGNENAASANAFHLHQLRELFTRWQRELRQWEKQWADAASRKEQVK
jgi:hypothetical protein